MRFPVQVFLTVVTLAWAGCQAKPEFVAKRTITVALELEAKRTAVAAKVGDLIKLELPPVELAGYGWQVFLHDSRFLTQKTEVIPAPAADGRPTVDFLALRVHPKTTVRFLLVKQDGAKVAQPIDGHDVVFKIQ